MNISHLGRADLHIHTCASDGIPTVREVLNYVEHHNHLNIIAITDHDRMDAALWAYEHRHEYTFDIIPGVEISSQAGHVLALWVTKPIPKNCSLEDTVEAIHEQDGIAILAHPYHIHMGVVAKNWLRYTRRPEVLLESKVDAVEVHNAGIIIPGANLIARRLAHKAGLAMTGSSDAHTLGAIGCGITYFKGRTAIDLRNAILNRQTVARGRAWPLNDYLNYSMNSTHNTSSEFLAERLPSNHPIHP